VERGERAEEALIREIKEETSLDATITGTLGTYPIDLRKKSILLIAFEAAALDGTFSPNSEVSEIGEFEPNSALEILRGKEERTILETWLKSKTPKVS
jgi:NADH pyrophosphatase NudC (nudix superfamily)